jgi:transposase-like protein
MSAKMDPLKLKKEFEHGLLADRYKSMHDAYYEWVRLADVFKKTGNAKGVNEACAHYGDTLAAFNGVAIHKLKQRFGAYQSACEFRKEVFEAYARVNDDDPVSYLPDNE